MEQLVEEKLIRYKFTSFMRLRFSVWWADWPVPLRARRQEPRLLPVRAAPRADGRKVVQRLQRGLHRHTGKLKCSRTVQHLNNVYNIWIMFCTGLPVRLFTKFCWHQNKSSITDSLYYAHATFNLVSPILVINLTGNPVHRDFFSV